MNKKILISVVIAIALFGLGMVIVQSNRSSTSNQPSSSIAETKKESPSPQQKSLKDLLSLNQPQECSFNDGSGNSGVVFVNAGKVRGDFIAETDGKKINSHSIVDGQTAYFWMDGQTEGYKIPLNMTAEKQISSPSPNEQVDLDKKVDYRCKNWATDPTFFNLPKDIKFRDFGALVSPNTTKQTDDNTPSSACSACESLTGDAKAQCKSALKCS